MSAVVKFGIDSWLRSDMGAVWGLHTRCVGLYQRPEVNLYIPSS